MKDSGFEWIIYGVAMFVGLIGMINKARKQAKQQQTSAQPPQFPWENDEDEEMETYRPQPVPVYPSQQQWQNTTYQVVPGKKGEAMQEMVAPEGGRTTYDKISAEPQPNRNHHKDHHAEDQTDHVIDFDLRKAVIYSEILKPKYNEY